MRSGWVGFLKVVAWINVICSFIASIWIFIKFGKTEITEGIYFQYTSTVTNWPAVGIGIGLMFESLLVLAFFMVIAHITEQTENMNFYLNKIEMASRNFNSPEESSHSSLNTTDYSKKIIIDPDKWECPKCYNKNPNTVYVCEKCNYHIK